LVDFFQEARPRTGSEADAKKRVEGASPDDDGGNTGGGTDTHNEIPFLGNAVAGFLVSSLQDLYYVFQEVALARPRRSGDEDVSSASFFFFLIVSENHVRCLALF
jgi:hypothetical protein